MNRIYLCGPMTGFPESNLSFISAFNREENRLEELGYQVFNPTDEEYTEPESTKAQRFHELVDAILECDTLALLDGWESFLEANFIVMLATRLGMNIITSKTLTARRGEMKA